MIEYSSREALQAQLKAGGTRDEDLPPDLPFPSYRVFAIDERGLASTIDPTEGVRWTPKITQDMRDEQIEVVRTANMRKEIERLTGAISNAANAANVRTFSLEKRAEAKAEMGRLEAERTTLMESLKKGDVEASPSRAGFDAAEGVP